MDAPLGEPIHPSAWKGCSANFAPRGFSDIRNAKQHQRYAPRPTYVSLHRQDTKEAIAARGGGLYPFFLRPAKKRER